MIVKVFVATVVEVKVPELVKVTVTWLWLAAVQEEAADVVTFTVGVVETSFEEVTFAVGVPVRST
ncbi:MAG: hypothetical protein ACYCSX_17660 [Acidimicrobiales bacterium]